MNSTRRNNQSTPNPTAGGEPWFGRARPVPLRGGFSGRRVVFALPAGKSVASVWSVGRVLRERSRTRGHDRRGPAAISPAPGGGGRGEVECPTKLAAAVLGFIVLILPCHALAQEARLVNANLQT